MRRTTMLAVLMGLLLSPLPGITTAQADESTDPAQLPAESSSRVAMTALDTAGRVLAGDGLAGDPSASVALRDLWLARPDVAGEDAAQADSLLARPTEGAADPFGDGYTVPATSQCGAKICVHYVPTTADAPPSVDWVGVNLATLEAVYDREVNQLGFRPPRTDGGNGGDSKFDVYLKDLGSGLYGYCAPEYRKKGRTASGFCVLDNDYAAAQFPSQTPEANLTVTAAHEFFHAVQYSYDYDEDPWMLESTATWMEEQVATDINDNRQYLPASQMQASFIPLDTFSSTNGFQYGNWIFWQYLTDRFGVGLVKKAWKSAGSLRGDGGRYSLQAIAQVLRKKKQSFTDVYADFAAGNIVPANTYAEAAGVPEYANPAQLSVTSLTAAAKSAKVSARIDHLASEAMTVRSGPDFVGKKWRLRVSIKGPGRSASPAARLLVYKNNGKISTRKVKFNKRGRASSLAPFDSTKILGVTVVFANVSTRLRCGKGTDLACQGKAKDDNKKFKVVTKVVKQSKKKHKGKGKGKHKGKGKNR